MGKQSEVLDRNAGAASPSTGSASSMPGASPQDPAMARALNQVQAQTPEAVQTINAQRQEAASAPTERVASETSPGREQAQGATPAQASIAEGQKLQEAGVKMDAPQAPDPKGQLQSSLDNSGKNGQDAPQQTSVCAAAREEAKNAPSEKAQPEQTMQR